MDILYNYSVRSITVLSSFHSTWWQIQFQVPLVARLCFYSAGQNHIALQLFLFTKTVFFKPGKKYIEEILRM